jgi:hypothetical protein
MNNMTPDHSSLRPWHNYMPSKKIQITIGIIVLALVIYGLRHPIAHVIQKIKNTPAVVPVTALPKPSTAQTETVLSIDKDTDGDGILDWQETLLGTNPNVPNSKDEIPQEIRELASSSEQLVDTSDKLALRVYQRLKTEPKGENINEAIQAATTKEILDYANSIDEQYTTYTLADLNLVDDTADARKSYAVTVKPSLEKIIPNNIQTEQIYQQLLGNNSKSLLTYETGITKAIHDLLQMPVPLKLSENHLILLNAMNHLQLTLTSSHTTKDQTNMYALFLVFQKNLNLAVQASTALAAMLQPTT